MISCVIDSYSWPLPNALIDYNSKLGFKGFTQAIDDPGPYFAPKDASCVREDKGTNLIPIGNMWTKLYIIYIFSVGGLSKRYETNTLLHVQLGCMWR